MCAEHLRSVIYVCWSWTYFPLLAPSPRRLGEERLHRLGVERAGRDHDRRVEAREPDLRADEVDVQRVGQRVDEAADEEERRELGEERGRKLLLDGDDEAADREDGGLPARATPRRRRCDSRGEGTLKRRRDRARCCTARTGRARSSPSPGSRAPRWRRAPWPRGRSGTGSRWARARPGLRGR